MINSITICVDSSLNLIVNFALKNMWGFKNNNTCLELIENVNSVEAKLHGESKVIQRCFDDNNDDNKG